MADNPYLDDLKAFQRKFTVGAALELKEARRCYDQGLISEEELKGLEGLYAPKQVNKEANGGRCEDAPCCGCCG